MGMTDLEQRAWSRLTGEMAGGMHQYDYWEDAPEQIRQRYVDRELLELAAKAAGLRVKLWEGHSGTMCAIDDDRHGRMWMPLHDDGNALRLAVKLSLFDGLERRASEIAAQVNYDMDPCEATRRAIVRAAAEIQLQKERNEQN